MSHLEFLRLQEKFAPEIVDQVLSKTLWSPTSVNNKVLMEELARLARVPFDSQVEKAILPLYQSLMTYKVAVLIGEMGVGKTQISFSTAWLALKNEKNRKLLFLSAGTKHLENMANEGKEILKGNVILKIAINKNRFERRAKHEITPEEIAEDVVPEGKICVYVLSKDSAKMSLKEVPVFNWEDKCPNCGQKIVTKSHKDEVAKAKKKGLPAPKVKSRTKPLDCPSCDYDLTSKVAKNICIHSVDENGDSLTMRIRHQYKRDENGKILLNEEGEAIIEEIREEGLFPRLLKKQYKAGMRKTSFGEKCKRLQKNSRDKTFGMLIVDEAHEMQSGDSQQGKTYRELVNISEKTMIMTGTLSNGYSSSVFHILQGLMPSHFRKLGYEFKDVSKFVDHYGAKKSETVTTRSNGNKKITKVSELPKISDRVVSLLAPFTVWLKMDELNLSMPPYRESSRIVPADEDFLIKLNSYKKEVVSKLKETNPNLVKSFAGMFMYLQDNPTHEFCYDFTGYVQDGDRVDSKGEPIKIPQDFSFPFDSYPKYDPEREDNRIFEKEKVLIDDIASHKKQGRKMLVYSIYNKAAGVSTRLEEVIKASVPGITVNVMPDSIGGKHILPWINNNSDADVVICSPKKVATGYNLVQFSTFMFYESGTNLREAQQAARRGWRAVGQEKDVEVIFYAYEGIQANILEIMSKKMRAAATVDGKKVMVGQLAEEFDDERDITEALNSIADNIQRKYVADFSASYNDGGQQRDKTELEQEYSNILARVRKEKAETEIKVETEVKKETITDSSIADRVSNDPVLEENDVVGPISSFSEPQAPINNIIGESIAKPAKELKAALTADLGKKPKTKKATPKKEEALEIMIDKKGQMSFVF